MVRFAADFEQHCEGATPALHGSVRVNASAAFPPAPDTDADGVADTMDDCPAVADPSQSDLDHDGVGDACDPQLTNTSLTFRSDPGDYIGGGQIRTWYPLDGAFTVTHANGTVAVDFDGLEWWTLDFRAPAGADVAPGAYEGATRYPFQAPTTSGLSVYGTGRGCNTLTGRFDVLEAVYAPDGSVLRFSADFEQHCEGGIPALRGSVRSTPRRRRASCRSPTSPSPTPRSVHRRRPSRSSSPTWATPRSPCRGWAILGADPGDFTVATDCTRRPRRAGRRLLARPGLLADGRRRPLGGGGADHGRPRRLARRVPARGRRRPAPASASATASASSAPATSTRSRPCCRHRPPRRSW